MNRYVVGVAVAAVAAGSALLAAAPAYAYNGTGNAPWEPDSQALGSVVFYNAAGQPVTSGTSLTAPFAYAAASNNNGTAGTKAQLQWAFPNHSQPTSAWFTDAPGTATTYPNASAPAPLNTDPNPVNTVGSNANINAISGAGSNDTTAGYNQVLQVRLVTLGGAGGSSSNLNGKTYWASDILYNKTTGTWTEVGNDDQQNITYTALSATPSSAPAGNSVQLQATVTQTASGSIVPGSVQFYDGTTALGSPVATANGVATTSTSTLTAGSHNIAAVFTPTDTTSNSASTGTATENITGPATTTTLTVSATNSSDNQPSGAPYAGVDTTLSGAVTLTNGGAAVSAGTVSFYDNGGSTPINASPVTPAANGSYTYDDAAGFAAGNHSVVAVFTPTDPANDAASQSSAVAFASPNKPAGACTNTASSCTSTSDVQAGIPVGTITITTPYNGTSCGAGITQGTAPNPNSTTSNPGCVNGVLNIGTLALTPNNSEFTAHTTFQDIVVNDNLSGTQLWSVSALSSPLTDGGTKAGSTIGAKYVGLTGLAQNTAEEGANQFSGTVTTANATAATPATGDPNAGLANNPTIATATTPGQGAYAMDGTITLNAPTSTEAGVFTGTVTFTVATQ